MKRPSVTGMVFFVLILLVLSFSWVSPVFADEADYMTDSFEVKIDIDENHLVHVQETIQVNFIGQHHGIYRYIPENRREYTIENVKVPGEKVRVESGYLEGAVSRQSVVRIGDPDKTVSGEHQYRIEYDLVWHKDSNPEIDTLSLDLFPSEWDTPVREATVTLTMPGSIESYSIYQGSYGEKTENGAFQVASSSENTVFAAGSNVPANYGLTIESALPEGYWIHPLTRGNTQNYGWLPFAAGAGILTLLWFFFGRDPRIVKTVEYEPPEGMTPPEVDYILHGSVSNRGMHALILYCACKGYLSIEESADGKSVLFRKRKPPGEREKDFVKEYFNGLFGAKDTARPDRLPDSFSKHLASAKESLRNTMEDSCSGIYTKPSKLLRKTGYLLMFLMPVISGILLGYPEYDTLGKTVIMVHYALFYVAGAALIIRVIDRRRNRPGIPGMLITVSGFLAGLLLTGISIHVMEVSAGDASQSSFRDWIPLVICFSCILMILMTLLMWKRTDRGAELYGRVLGFRDYIRTEKPDHRKGLTDANPTYYYNLLPYAHVMNLAGAWTKKFDHIPTDPPEWYTYHSPDPFRLITMYMIMKKVESDTDRRLDQLHELQNPSGSRDSGFSGGSFSGGGGGGGGGGAW